MPEHEAVPFPPMTPLRGAVPGYPLTPVSTPDAARLTLRAEAETSVLDPVGMRRLWVGDLLGLVMAGIGTWVLVDLVRSVLGDHEAASPVWGWLLFCAVGATMQLALVFTVRARPESGTVPLWPVANLRWHLAVRRRPVVVPPPAAWPPGSEAYAVLSGVASVESVAPSWLAGRVGLTPEVGDQWVDSLRRHGWVAGGGRLLGAPRLPELHLRVTEVGRQVLDDERARLQALATR